ncbi:putative thiazole-containing bacteriocin maturation protein [Oceanobacillus salinisoli]|uniref:putative thiazole-containing bacteriocin maturation protein n=1 Tax=Oceanobacillus salinisoli TaxID=2678611 RepID=UPI0012E2257F|nr:putative thiazole-containing bacteriocin maturation protein [Oceanobacillus salinisoli]
MTKLNPSMRLKVKRDTFFIPDGNGGAYFRNNLCSFHIEGKTIYQWIEKLIPLFNGRHTLQDLTDGLPNQYRDHVYKIADMLYSNGFVRDISRDHPHQLPKEVYKKYASQIELLDNLSESGAYRFQSYREAKVLAIGSGSFFVSLISALLESGLPKFDMVITDSAVTNKQRLKELVANARKTDLKVNVNEITFKEDGESFWREIIQPFDWILYISQEGEIEELQVLHSICREEKKCLLPAMIIQQAGIAGPLVYPEEDGCWESAWRRVHRNVLQKDPKLHTFSSTAGALLANVIVFKLFKAITGLEEKQNPQLFLLNLETLEGNWHSFIPHPLVTGSVSAKWVRNLNLLLKQNSNKNELDGVLHYFSSLTSTVTGIFHVWEEGDLKQLPLAQCRVKVADPISEEPAELLPEIICTGLTHEEACRETALTGIEAYLSQMKSQFIESISFYQEIGVKKMDKEVFIGIGAGETIIEGVYRGLQKCLAEELRNKYKKKKPPVVPIKLNAIEDERSQFYLQALTKMQEVPIIGLGEEISGFPVVWVGTKDCWYGGVGFNVTIATRNVLQHALSKVQNKAVSSSIYTVEISSVVTEENESQCRVIPTSIEMTQLDMLQSALKNLKQNHKQLLAFELIPESYLKERLAGMFGVLLREEEFK